MLVVEERSPALARGAHIYGELLGFGSGRDRPTYVGDPDPTGRAFLPGGDGGLAEARARAGDIDHVSAHAPGVTMTDLAELRALRGSSPAARARPAVTSIKGALGHPLAAAGVLQTVGALLALRDGVVPPDRRTATSSTPSATLDVVRGAAPRRPAAPALVTAHGFGGQHYRGGDRSLTRIRSRGGGASSSAPDS